MFKKTIIASAIAVVSMNTMAATWDTNFSTAAAKHSIEGIEGVVDATGILVSSGGVVRTESEYYVGDLIKLTYSVGLAGANVFPTSFKSHIPGDAAATLEVVAGATSISIASTNLISATATTRAAFADADVVKVGDQITFGDAATIVHTVTGIAPGNNDGDFVYAPVRATAPAQDTVITVKAPAVMDLGRQSVDANSVTYRVGAITGTATRVGAAIPLPAGVLVKAADLATTAATVSFASTNAGGAALETTSTAAAIGSAVAAFVQTITPLDGVVDVEKDRKALVGGTTTTSADTLVMAYVQPTLATGSSISQLTGNLTLPANNAAAKDWASETVIHTIDGDFAFMDNGTAAGVQVTGLADTSGTTTPAMATTGAKFTVTDTAVSATNTITITKNVAAAVIPVQAFSGKSVFTYNNSAGTAKTKTVTHASLGAFTLNGAAVTAYAVPMGSTVSRFLWVSNKGSTAASLNATVIAEGVSYGPYSIGSAAGLKATSVGGLIDTALTGAGVTLPNNSRATITIDSPVKQADITVSASYKHIGDADRLLLETSDTLEDTLSQGAITTQGSAALVVNKK